MATTSLRDARERAFESSSWASTVERDSHVGALERQNFDLKMRVFYLEERLKQAAAFDASADADEDERVQLHARLQEQVAQTQAVRGRWQEAEERVRSLEADLESTAAELRKAQDQEATSAASHSRRHAVELEAVQEALEDERAQAQAARATQREVVSTLEKSLSLLREDVRKQRGRSDDLERELASAVERAHLADGRLEQLRGVLAAAERGLADAEAREAETGRLLEATRRLHERERAASARAQAELEERTRVVHAYRAEVERVNSTAAEVAAIQVEEIHRLEEKASLAARDAELQVREAGKWEQRTHDAERKARSAAVRSAQLEEEREELAQKLQAQERRALLSEKRLTQELAHVAKQCLELRRANDVLQALQAPSPSASLSLGSPVTVSDAMRFTAPPAFDGTVSSCFSRASLSPPKIDAMPAGPGADGIRGLPSPSTVRVELLRKEILAVVSRTTREIGARDVSSPDVQLGAQGHARGVLRDAQPGAQTQGAAVAAINGAPPLRAVSSTPLPLYLNPRSQDPAARGGSRSVGVDPAKPPSRVGDKKRAQILEMAHHAHQSRKRHPQQPGP